MNPAEKRWVILAFVVIIAGVVVGILHQLGIVPVLVSTISTVLMSVAAITAAIIGMRASNRNENNG